MPPTPLPYTHHGYAKTEYSTERIPDCGGRGNCGVGSLFLLPFFGSLFEKPIPWSGVAARGAVPQGPIPFPLLCCISRYARGTPRVPCGWEGTGEHVLTCEVGWEGGGCAPLRLYPPLALLPFLPAEVRRWPRAAEGCGGGQHLEDAGATKGAVPGVLL